VSTSNGGGAANDALVETYAATDQVAHLEAYAADCERAVTVIEEKLAGIKTSLADAKTNAKRARAEADEARKSAGGQ
jgi:hypothetical protein